MKKKVVDEQKVEEVLEPVVEETTEPAVEKVEAEVVTTGVVTANLLNIRSGPSKDTNPIGTLAKGEKVEYTVENNKWLKLTNRVGYVMKEFIQ